MQDDVPISDGHVQVQTFLSWIFSIVKGELVNIPEFCGILDFSF